MSEFSIDDFDFSGVPTIERDGDDDGKALRRQWDKLAEPREHEPCGDWLGWETGASQWAFRMPQPGMMDALADLIRPGFGAYSGTVYDVTTRWALHFALDDVSDHAGGTRAVLNRWAWEGPCEVFPAEEYLEDVYRHWTGCETGVRLFWWDGGRLQEVPRKSQHESVALEEKSYD